MDSWGLLLRLVSLELERGVARPTKRQSQNTSGLTSTETPQLELENENMDEQLNVVISVIGAGNSGFWTKTDQHYVMPKAMFQEMENQLLGFFSKLNETMPVTKK